MRDRKQQRTQCIYIRMWQVNTHGGSSAAMLGDAFRGVNVQCGRQTTGALW